MASVSAPSPATAPVSNTILGTAVYAGAQLYEESKLLQNYGAESVFAHLTHCTLFVLVALLGLHALCSIVREGMAVFFGKYWRNRRLVFSLLPLCQGLCGSQK